MNFIKLFCTKIFDYLVDKVYKYKQYKQYKQ